MHPPPATNPKFALGRQTARGRRAHSSGGVPGADNRTCRPVGPTQAEKQELSGVAYALRARKRSCRAVLSACSKSRFPRSEHMSSSRCSPLVLHCPTASALPLRSPGRRPRGVGIRRRSAARARIRLVGLEQDGGACPSPKCVIFTRRDHAAPPGAGPARRSGRPGAVVIGSAGTSALSVCVVSAGSLVCPSPVGSSRSIVVAR